MMRTSQLAAYGDMSKVPGNFDMECQECGMKQKNRAFCYFCQAVRITNHNYCNRCKNFQFVLTADE